MVPSPPEVGRWQGCKTGTAPAKSSGAAVQVSARRDPQQTVGRHCQDSHHKRNGADRQIRGGPGPPAHGERPRPERQRRQRNFPCCSRTIPAPFHTLHDGLVERVERSAKVLSKPLDQQKVGLSIALSGHFPVSKGSFVTRSEGRR